MFTQLNHIHRDDDPIAVHAEENLKYVCTYSRDHLWLISYSNQVGFHQMYRIIYTDDFSRSFKGKAEHY